jgi:hypothetical protein
MKTRVLFSILLSLILFTSCNSTKNDSKEKEVNQRIYLGQKPPGDTPKLFAPEIIKTEYREGAYTFSADLKEFYFRRRGGAYKYNTLVVVKYEDNQWKEFFIKTKSREPSISPDGKIMHLGKNYRKLTNTGWSEPISLGTPFKDYRIMRLTSSSNKTYYFDEASESGPLRYSRFINGKHEEPKAIRIEDMGDWNAHPYIAPDESYIIWDDQREIGGNGGADLYISFRRKDGSWGNSINLGNQINSEHNDAYGSISPDGKYFFFIRSYGGNKADIYWVDASVVLSLKPNE